MKDLPRRRRMHLFGIHEILGYCAAALTLLTFAQSRMLPMRIFASAANVLFIGYGVLGGLYPVAVLHVLLLPINLKRLIDLLRARSSSAENRITRGF
jgi:hypothetical protein